MQQFAVKIPINSDNFPIINFPVSELSRLSQVEHSFATAYSKEENGLVERANQEVMWHLSAMLFDDKWSYEQLPIVQCIMNTVEKMSTGVTPAELILNNSIRLSNRVHPTLGCTAIDPSQSSVLQPPTCRVPVYSYVLFTPPVE